MTRADSGTDNPGAASDWTTGSHTVQYDTTATSPVWVGAHSRSPIVLEIFASNVGASNASEAVDSTAPQLQSATVDGYTLTLAYDEPLDETDTPPGSAFTVNVGGSPGWIRSVVVDQSDVRVYVADPVGGGTVTVDYTVPTDEAEGRVQDTSGNAAGSFSGQAVTNNTTDQVAPLFQSATVDEHTVTLTYDETLDETKTPPGSAFIVNVGGSPRTVSSVVVDQKDVRVNVADPVEMGDTVTVDYTVPTSAVVGRVQDTSGNAAVSLSEQAVTNNTTASGGGGGGERSDEQAPPGVPARPGCCPAAERQAEGYMERARFRSRSHRVHRPVEGGGGRLGGPGRGVRDRRDEDLIRHRGPDRRGGVRRAGRCDQGWRQQRSLRGGHRHAAGDHASRAFVGRSGRRRADPHIQRSAGHWRDPGQIGLRGDRGGKQPGCGRRIGVGQ